MATFYFTGAKRNFYSCSLLPGWVFFHSDHISGSRLNSDCVAPVIFFSFGLYFTWNDMKMRVWISSFDRKEGLEYNLIYLFFIPLTLWAYRPLCFVLSISGIWATKQISKHEIEKKFSNIRSIRFFFSPSSHWEKNQLMNKKYINNSSSKQTSNNLAQGRRLF